MTKIKSLFNRKILLFLVPCVFGFFLATFLLSANIGSKTNFAYPWFFNFSNGIGGSTTINAVSSAGVLLFIFSSYFFVSCWKEYLQNKEYFWTRKVLSICYVLAILIGISFSNVSPFYFGPILTLEVLSLFIFFDMVLMKVITLVNDNQNIIRVKKSKISIKYFAAIFGSIFLLWAPFLFGLYPGTVPWDAMYQLNQWVGVIPWDNHHPWVLSFIRGCIFSFGSIVNDNFGAYLNVLVFGVYECFCYTVICCILSFLGLPKLVIMLVIAFFGVLPFFPSFAASLLKDGPYAASLALYVSLLYLVFLKLVSRQNIRKFILPLFISSLPVIFFRNEGIFIVLITLFFLFFWLGTKHKLLFVGVVFTLISCVSFVHYEGKEYLNVKPQSIGTALSVPFQQTARYVKTYPTELTEKEVNTINKVLDVRKIAQLYNPNISDPVMSVYKRNSTKEEVFDYLEVWFEMFLKHPLLYIEAFLNHIYGYIYPFAYTPTEVAFFIEIIQDPNVNKGAFDFSFKFPEMVKHITEYTFKWYQLPFFATLLSPGFYFFLLMFSFAYKGPSAQSKFSEKFFIILPPLLAIIVCFLSPVNGLIRYFLPVFALFPLSFILGIFYGRLKTIMLESVKESH